VPPNTALQLTSGNVLKSEIGVVWHVSLELWWWSEALPVATELVRWAAGGAPRLVEHLSRRISGGVAASSVEQLISTFLVAFQSVPKPLELGARSFEQSGISHARPKCHRPCDASARSSTGRATLHFKRRERVPETACARLLVTNVSPEIRSVGRSARLSPRGDGYLSPLLCNRTLRKVSLRPVACVRSVASSALLRSV